MDTQQRSCNLQLKAIDKDRRTFRVTASSAVEDAYGESVTQDWNLARFRANPVILFGHASHELPIGKAISIDVVGGRLDATIELATAAANPVAEQVWQSILQGTIRAVSVGFRSGKVSVEQREGREILTLSNNTLYEISVVPVPANPEALIYQRALGGARAMAPTPADSSKALVELIERAMEREPDDEDDDDDEGGPPSMAAVLAEYSRVNPYVDAAKKDLATRWQCSVDSLSEMVVRDHAEKLEREADAAHFARVKREAEDAAVAAAKAAEIVDGRSYGGDAAAIYLEKQMDLSNMIADAIAAQHEEE